MQKINFNKILKRAETRKGGKKKLQSLLPKLKSITALKRVKNDRCLSMMTKMINQAGFHWGVIEKKWPQFEEAFFKFNLDKLAMLSPDQWENYMQDTRVVRNWQKIKTVYDNLGYIEVESAEHGSFAKFLAQWPTDDQIGLMAHMKKHGSRLGGNTGQRFLRRMGKDAFILSHDMVLALKNAGLEVADNPTSKRDQTKIQTVLNQIQQETNLPYTHISKVLSYSVGENYAVEEILDWSH